MHDIDGPEAGKPDAPQMEMPRYVSHKKVWALEIDTVAIPKMGDTHVVSHRKLSFRDTGYAPIEVPAEMFSRYVPVPGDFYVVYADGYKSFSPRKAFLEGYTRDEPNARELGAALRDREEKLKAAMEERKVVS